MRVLIVGPKSVHLSNFIQLMEGSVSDYLFLTDSPPNESSQKFKVVNFSLKKLFDIRKSIVEMERIINEFDPDIIHVHQAGTHAFLILRAAGRSIPVIVTAWGSDVLVIPQRSYVYKKMVQFILKRATRITSDSIHMAEVMRSLVKGLKPDISIINYGIDEIISQPNKEKLFYSNRLHEKLYRINFILEGFKRFIESSGNDEYKLIIAGTGKETNALMKLSKVLGIQNSVEFAGWVNKKTNQDYYSKALFFISIPQSDATSISLLEAMSAGCIPVVSDLPANREWVKDGENGIIVSDLKENYLERAIGLNLEKVQDINQKIYFEKASKEVNRKKFVDLYQNILQQKQ